MSAMAAQPAAVSCGVVWACSQACLMAWLICATARSKPTRTGFEAPLKPSPMILYEAVVMTAWVLVPPPSMPRKHGGSANPSPRRCAKRGAAAGPDEECEVRVFDISLRGSLTVGGKCGSLPLHYAGRPAGQGCEPAHRLTIGALITVISD